MDTIHIAPTLQNSNLTIVTRKQLAIRMSLSLRYVDELTRNGVLPYFKIGKSIRYDFAEVESVLRERFHVRAKPARIAAKTLIRHAATLLREG